MHQNILIFDRLPSNFLKRLDAKNICLWLPNLKAPSLFSDLTDFNDFLALPWAQILSEASPSSLLASFESLKTLNDKLSRKRGLVYIFENEPNSVELPRCSLPIYLLNGKGSGSSFFAAQSRKFAMLNALKQATTEEIVILLPRETDLSEEFKLFFSSDLAIDVTFIVDDRTQLGNIEALAQEYKQNVTIVVIGIKQFIRLALDSFFAVYSDDRLVIKVKSFDDSLSDIDITDAVSGIPGNIFEHYSIVTTKYLTRLSPEDLPEEEFNAFFSSEPRSWKPFAAQLPWQRDSSSIKLIEKNIKRIELEGPDENKLCFFTAEPGSGCTTTLHMIAWNIASKGYPVIIAQKLPDIPDALQLTTYLFQARSIISAHERNHGDRQSQKHETPWVLVFDTDHWRFRENDLLSFFREIKNSGRPVCIVAAFNKLPSLQSISVQRVGHISHQITSDQASEIGRCVNKFLQFYGKARTEHDWKKFYEEHTIENRDGGIVSFWIALSFWIRFYIDLGESIQGRLFDAFMQEAADTETKLALLEIAAMSAERFMLPEDVLPPKLNAMPTSHVLREKSLDIPMLTLSIVRADVNCWALSHDILGVLLLNAVATKNALLSELGFSQIHDAIHLRLQLLARIASNDSLGKKWNRKLAEDFATTIFKIDPEHGRGVYSHYWRDILHALDSIPNVIRQTSRLFLHHTAISRRRICSSLGKNESAALFGITDEIKRSLLTRAIDDLNFALERIPYSPGDETDVNLYNTLSISYLDLAQVEETLGIESRQTILGLRSRANDAGRKAFEVNPTNSFVLETYVKNLLTSAEEAPGAILPNCIAALDILYSAIGSNSEEYRHSRLGSLVRDALELLFSDGASLPDEFKNGTPYGPLLEAWRVLLPDVRNCAESIHTMDFSRESCVHALEILNNSSCEYNLYLLNLKYRLTRIVNPYSYAEQIVFVEQIVETGTIDPQIKLEYAILLYMCGRFKSGEQEFRRLRTLWREKEFFITVPENLKWLREAGSNSPIRASAKVGASGMYTPRAIVDNLQGQAIPFKPEAFGLREARAGQVLTGYVSFNYKGPFFRPSCSE